jgi:hypothetical protein
MTPPALRPRLAVIRRISLGVSVFFLAIFAAITMLQDQLLYFPQKASIAEVTSPSLRPWPSAENFRGLLAEPGGTVRATAILFHGNAGHAGQRTFYAQMLNRLGVRVILAEYPGYGPRPGQPSEARLVADAESSITLAHEHYGKPLLLIGESLGAAVAAAATDTQTSLIDGLLLITPWDKLANVAKHHYGWLPVDWLLHDRYDSLAHLADFHHPTIVVLAEQDEIVPPSFGRTLYQSLAAPKRLDIMPEAGHNTWWENATENWWHGVVDFLLSGL